MQEFQIFQGNQPLPTEWDFITSSNQVALAPEDGILVQLGSQLGSFTTFLLGKSTLTADYRLADLKQAIRIHCGIPATVPFDVRSHCTPLTNDELLNNLIEVTPLSQQGLRVFSVEIHAAASRKPCLMCLSTDCHHQSNAHKRKSRQEQPSVNLLEPTKAFKRTPVASCKKRRTLACSTDLLNRFSLNLPLVEPPLF